MPLLLGICILAWPSEKTILPLPATENSLCCKATLQVELAHEMSWIFT